MPLDAEIAAYLESQKGQPPRMALTPAETRATMRRSAALAGLPPPMRRVEDIVAGGVPARSYWPSDGELPIVVYFHGGRFFSGDLESHDPTCRHLASASECRVVAVDYRLAPEHRFPAAYDDARSAVEWACAQASPVAVAGDSAGANLAAAAALAFRHGRLKCQLLVYPMIDATCSMPSHGHFATGYGPGSADMARGWREYLPPDLDRRHPCASPLFAEDVSGAPPAMIMTAEFDSLRDEGEAYAGKLRSAGVDVELRRYDGTIHGFFTMYGVSRLARQAMADAGAFLRAHLSYHP